jgi:galactosamine-6-phosphate isomerase
MGYTGRMETTRANGLKIRVLASYDAMSQAATDFLCREVRQLPNLLLCVPAGGTPTRTYALLAARHTLEPGLFNLMRVLQVDEWLGLAPGNPATCQADLRTKLLRPLGIPSKRFKGFRTDATNPEAERSQMARWLVANGPIDVCILGLGANGHVAMNEPAKTLIPHAHVATLAEGSRHHAMLKDLAKKPRYGLTLGMADILQARRVLLLVNGKRKRAALSRLMKLGVTTSFPASFLGLHPDVTVLCDREAAGDSAVDR